MAEKYNIPTTNMIVRQCCMRDGHGAVTVGSEIAAGLWMFILKIVCL